MICHCRLHIAWLILHADQRRAMAHLKPCARRRFTYLRYSVASHFVVNRSALGRRPRRFLPMPPVVTTILACRRYAHFALHSAARLSHIRLILSSCRCRGFLLPRPSYALLR